MSGRASSRSICLPRKLRARGFPVGAFQRGGLALIDAWPDWPAPRRLLVGPRRAGKSHLAAIWARLGARILARATFRRDARFSATGALCSRMSAGALDECALFHLLNLVREEDASLLLTARSCRSPGVPPDLVSRLRALPRWRWSPPDDALLRPLLVKLFVDRQLTVGTSVVAYLVARLERSFAAARPPWRGSIPRRCARAHLPALRRAFSRIATFTASDAARKLRGDDADVVRKPS
ncbi:MAG: hypothetical protein QM722_00995 [Piscinibacter sp.]